MTSDRFVSFLIAVCALLFASASSVSAQRAFGDNGALLVAPPRGGVGATYPIEDDRLLTTYSYSDPEGTIGFYIQVFDSRLEPVLEDEGVLLSPPGENWYLAASCGMRDGVVIAARDSDQRGRYHLNVNRWDSEGNALWGEGVQFEYVNYWEREYLFRTADDDVILAYPDAAGEDSWHLFRFNRDGSYEENWPADGLRLPQGELSFLQSGEEVWLTYGAAVNRILSDGTLLFDEPRIPEIPDAQFHLDAEVLTFIPRTDGLLYMSYIDTAQQQNGVALINLDGEVIATFLIFPYEENNDWPYTPSGLIAFVADPRGRLYIALYGGLGEGGFKNIMMLLDPEAEEPLVWGEEGVEFESPGYDGVAYDPQLTAADNMVIMTFGYAISDMLPVLGEAVIGFNDEGERIPFVESLIVGKLVIDEQGRMVSVYGGLENYSICKFDVDGVIVSARNRFPNLRSAVTYPGYFATSAGGVRSVWLDRKHGLTLQELDDTGEQQRDPRGDVVRVRNQDEAYAMGLFSIMLGDAMVTLLTPEIEYDYYWVDYTLDGAKLVGFEAEGEVAWEYAFPDSLAQEWLYDFGYASGDSMALLSCYYGLYFGIDREGVKWNQRIIPGGRSPFAVGALPGIGWGMVNYGNDTLNLIVLDYNGEIMFNYADALSQYGVFYAAFEDSNIVYTGHFTRDRGSLIKKWHISQEGELIGEYENSPFTPDTIWAGDHRISVASAGNSWVLQYNSRSSTSALQLLDSRGTRYFGDGGYRRFYANKLYPDDAGGVWLVRYDNNHILRVLHLDAQGRFARPGYSDAGFLVFSDPVDSVILRPGRNSGELLVIADVAGQRRAQIIRDDLVSAPVEESAVPESITIYPAFPNPFNQSSVISYQLSVPGEVRLSLYDINGRLMETLVSGWQATGKHRVVIGGQTGMSVPLPQYPAGLYLVRMQAGEFTAVRKVTLVK